MICLETQHFKLNRLLLLVIGLWPYQESKLAQIHFIVFFSILTTFIAFQFTTFITSKCTADLMIKVLSSAFFFICLTIKYSSFRINTKIVKLSLERLQHTCNELQNRNEIAIIEKYGNIGKLYTSSILILGIFMFFILPIWPLIFDVILPMNFSRSRPAIQITTEYFVNQQNYFYLILLHTNAAIFIGGTAIIATGTMLLVYFKHICGMFNIASKRIIYSFRLETAMMINMLKNVNQEKETLIYKRIIYAIDIHRKATEYAHFLIKNFEGSFFFLIAAGTICLSSSLVQLTSSINNFEELLPPVIIIFALYIYLLISNYIAQQVMDHNNYVFATVYNVQWYVAPLRIQKMLLFMLQRGTKAFNLNLGGLFVGSLESAAMLTSASISYFTVLHSTQQH
ncbi:hypothetical protein P5V15_008174 [Pogonomyrmex californicus]